MRLPYILLVFLLPCCLSAQGPDQIVLRDGTVIEGRIRKSAPPTQSSLIKITQDQQVRTFKPGDIRSVRFGKSGIELRSIEVDLGAPGTIGSRDRRETRLGEVLADGDVSLIKVYLFPFEYDTGAAGSEPYLYVLRAEGNTFILRLTSILVYEMWHANPAQFRNLLKYIARDCDEAKELASDANFRDGSILSVLQAYQKCYPNLNLELNEKRLQGGVEIDHYAQLMYIDIRDGDFNDQQISAGIGYQAAARFTERLDRLSVMASVHYLYHSFRWREQSDVSQSILRGNFSIGYTPILRKQYALRLTGGLSNYHAVSSSFRSFFSNNYFLLNAGVSVLRERWVFGLHYEHFPGQIPRRPASQLLATVGYRIGG
ncbi:MAG: hypothetical protein WA952_02855 [Lewinella sp.]